MEEQGTQTDGPSGNSPAENHKEPENQYQPEIWYPSGDQGTAAPQDNAPRPELYSSRQLRPEQRQYQNPGMPKPPKKPLTRQAKVLIGLVAALAIILTALLIGLNMQNDKSAPSNQTESSEPAESSETTVSRSKDVVPNDGKGSASSIQIQPHKGTPTNAENVFPKISPSVVGVLASIPTDDGKPDESQGTGIIASSDGVILTNSHVIGNSRSTVVTIILNSGKQYDARILGYDKTSDLAVLKISAKGLTPAEFGSANELKVGQQVLAIGNPDGMNYSDSLTGGYVSALNRKIAGHSGNGMTYIQTDTAINPGNSGGPLCNLYGQVVGINSCKIVTTGYEGMGFSIPVSNAVSIINQLIKNGYVQGRTRLGIVCRLLPNYETATLGLKGGVQILSIDAECSLRTSGVEKGDILYQINGRDITSMEDITETISKYQPGEEIPAKVYSIHQQKTINTKIKLLEDKGETQKTISQKP